MRKGFVDVAPKRYKRPENGWRDYDFQSQLGIWLQFEHFEQVFCEIDQ